MGKMPEVEARQHRPQSCNLLIARLDFSFDTVGDPPREAKAIFTDYGQKRFDNWQRASHIFTDYVQAYRHWQHGEHDPCAFR